MTCRTIARVISAQATSDGAGVNLYRSLGSAALDHLDPFLLLDEFSSDQKDDYIAGFPDHPHRGFETVTYMLDGLMEHRDSAGNSGLLRSGGVQWMTAGRGIVHSEMPKQQQGLMRGFQLWVNLPAAEKMCRPRYQDIAPERVPVVPLEGGGTVRVIAGRSHGVEGPVSEVATKPLYLDVSVPAGQDFEQPVEVGHSAFCYPFEGTGSVAGEDVGARSLVVLGDGDRFRVRAGAGGLRLLLLTGRPLGEPVARYGPFVMNTEEEITQAIEDYRSGRLGRS